MRNMGSERLAKIIEGASSRTRIPTLFSAKSLGALVLRAPMGRDGTGEKYARCSVRGLIPPDWLCDLGQVVSHCWASMSLALMDQ